mmetsp:Transcript_9127/g.17189  ORF Transcript_9127/g.17189 Transcript_9127/m.17189 type:complete len:224 (+) Transcript_9127:370-1041(+)
MLQAPAVNCRNPPSPRARSADLPRTPRSGSPWMRHIRRYSRRTFLKVYSLSCIVHPNQDRRQGCVSTRRLNDKRGRKKDQRRLRHIRCERRWHHAGSRSRRNILVPRLYIQPLWRTPGGVVSRKPASTLQGVNHVVDGRRLRHLASLSDHQTVPQCRHQVCKSSSYLSCPQLGCPFQRRRNNPPSKFGGQNQTSKLEHSVQPLAQGHRCSRCSHACSHLLRIC